MSTDQKTAREAVARGIAAWDREEFEPALLIFKEVLADHPYFADVHNRAGLCHAMLGRSDEALGCFDAALAQNGEYAEAHLNRGIILNELGRHEEAEEAVARSGELDTRDSLEFPSDMGNRLAVKHAELGDLYMIAGHAEEAVSHYKVATDVRPRFMDIRSKYAEALIELGQVDEARGQLEYILELRPGFAGARIRLGVVYQRLGRIDDARREWSRCAVDDPDDMRAQAYLAGSAGK